MFWKNLGKLLVTMAFMSWAGSALSQYEHHVKHNMLLFGTEEVFADHIVYKVPHNYQIVLRLNFAEEVKQAYIEAKELFPQETLIYLLDSMIIADIGAAETITGSLIRRDATGKSVIIRSGITLSKGQFTVLYFDELPLSLQNSTEG